MTNVLLYGENGEAVKFTPKADGADRIVLKVDCFSHYYYDCYFANVTVHEK